MVEACLPFAQSIKPEAGCGRWAGSDHHARSVARRRRAGIASYFSHSSVRVSRPCSEPSLFSALTTI
jgi:hypothetical protein